MYWLVAVFHLIIMPIAAFHALVCKRDHRAALGWIGVVIIFPVVGPVLYFMFGINRLRTRARVFTGHHLPMMHFGYDRIDKVAGLENDRLAHLLPYPYLGAVAGRATGIPLTANNRVTPLFNGEEFFPRLIQCIDAAESYILLSSYLFSSKGKAGHVISALERAVVRGVKVRVIIDGLGAWYSLRKDALGPLRQAKVDVRLFRPPSLIPPSLDINLRNHRKIGVIDGRIGFFGGMNIDQRHMVRDPHNENPTEDVQFIAEGPVVASLHRLFGDDWHLITKEHLPQPPEPCDTEGKALCRVIDSGPGDKLNQLSMTLLGVFAAARQEIAIMVPYFLPSHEMSAALQAAKLRGVRVRVVLPEHSNLRYVDWATRNMLWELLVWDVEVYFKPAPFAHTKLIVVDHHYVLGGSANIDARSLRLNFELGVEIFDSQLAAGIHKHMDKVTAESRPASLAELDQRPFWQRVRDAFFWLFSSYL